MKATHSSTLEMAAAAALWLLAALSIVPSVRAQSYLPTAYIDIRRTHSNLEGVNIEYLYRIEATESDFAPQPPKGRRSYNGNPLGRSEKLPREYSSFPVVFPPDADPLLCNEANGESSYRNPVGTVQVEEMGTLYKKYVLVPRGQCSFEAKARSAQRLGAAGVMIYNTLHSRYESIDPNKEYTNEPYPDWGNIRWPEDMIDYECGDHRARDGIGLRVEIDTTNLVWNPPPYSEYSDNLMSGSVDDGNLCASGFERKGGTADEFGVSCPSERCLFTGKNVSDDGSIMEACCAWDIPVAMGSDGNDGDAVPQSEEEDIVIHAYFISMDDAEKLLTVIMDSLDSTNMEGAGDVNYISAVPYARWYPKFHYSTLVLWAMAIFTVWISCYESASEYRRSWKVISKALNEGLLVFSRNSVAPSPNLAPAVGGRRARADTDETIDLAEDVEFEVEMPAANGNNNEETVATDGNNNEEPIASSNEAHDSNFRINDEFEINGNGGTDAAFISANASTTSTPAGVSPESSPDEATLNTASDSITGETADRMDGVATTEGVTGESSENQQEPQQTQRVSAQSLVASRSPTPAERPVELHAMHAVLFVICASGILLLLFFFNLFKIVTLVYGIGGSACMSQIMFRPLYTRVLKEKHALKELTFLSCLGCLRVIDVITSLTSYSLGFAWIAIAFTHVNPLDNTYYWIVQDVIGVCYCIYVLGIIHINTIMVGTVLLVLVFFYDIFYVFLSPYIFGTSVMEDVATGGESNGDALFCYKYPSYYRCAGSQSPLPMMLVFPWILDYRGGFSMIGLGDIVLPGLLISFAARYDGAKFLTRKCSEASANGNVGAAASLGDMEYDAPVTRKQAFISASKDVFKSLKKGYFGPIMVAYAVGLSAAYAAVYGMQMGQPALLYIVPACLGTMFALGLKKRQLSDLWRGPKVMVKANRIVALADKIPVLRAAAVSAPPNNMPATTVV